MLKLDELPAAALEVLYHDAYTQYKQGCYSVAESLFRLLTSANAKEGKYWLGLGLSLQQSKQFDEALSAYDMAAALDAANPHVHLQAAECFFALGDKEGGARALAYAQKALKRQKEPEEAQLIRLKLLMQAWRQG